MDKTSIKPILDSLVCEYGSREQQLSSSPLSVLIQTIISQNTSDANSRRAFESLLASYHSWEDVAGASVDDIATSIKIGGLEEIKAKRIKGALGEIQNKRGKIELNFLIKLPLTEAREWLKQLPGVGTKTANCVLLFSLGRPALPVDTHVLRVSKRLGLIHSKTSVEQAHKLLESLVPTNDIYQFHVLMIEHGRRVCRAQRPRCTNCVLMEFCSSYEDFTAKVDRDDNDSTSAIA